MGKFEEDQLRLQIEQMAAAARQRDHEIIVAEVAAREQQAANEESARLLAQLKERQDEAERVRRSRWTLHVTRPGSPHIEDLISGRCLMENLIPPEGFPPGEDASMFEGPAPMVDVGEVPPLVLEARKRGLNI